MSKMYLLYNETRKPTAWNASVWDDDDNKEGGASVTRWWNKKLPIFSQFCLESSEIIFTWKLYYLKLPKNLSEYLGYICKKICYQEDKNRPIWSHWRRRRRGPHLETCEKHFQTFFRTRAPFILNSRIFLAYFDARLDSSSTTTNIKDFETERWNV